MPSDGQNPPSVKKGRPSASTLAAAGRPLWPLHLKPCPDELLSSWMVRLAHAHGLKIHTLGRLLQGADLQIWNRDLDRLAPKWLVDALCWHTATSKVRGDETTLGAYAGVLFRTMRVSSVLPWIMPLKNYHQIRTGFGMQFCAQCLAEDSDPYFRRRWRVAFYTYCPRHHCMLHDRCPQCGAPVNFHRTDFGQLDHLDAVTLTRCSVCNFDLRESPVVAPVFYDDSAYRAWNVAVLRLEHRGPRHKPRGVSYYRVLHQLCHLMTTRYRKLHLMEYVTERLRMHEWPTVGQRVGVENHSVGERHLIVQSAFWLVTDLRVRLTDAWKAGAVTPSALLRDFEDGPKSFSNIAHYMLSTTR